MTCKYFIMLYFALILFVSGCSASDDAEQLGWLYGTWQLSHNPDNDDEDDLLFKSDGQLLILTQHGQIQGEYALNGDALRMLFSVNAKPVITKFKVSPNKDKLIFENGAEYSRKVP